MSEVRDFLRGLVASRVPETSRAWIARAEDESARAAAGPSAAFATLVAQAGRLVPRGALAPSDAERARAHALLAGWDPERWSLVDAARALVVLARRDLDSDAGVAALEDCFQYADVGESCSLHRALCLAPDPRRFTWRAGEGCRSSMRVVYEAAACDTPLPATWFDDLAWRQLAIKAVFVGAPLWRVHGMDARLDAELARMALDLVEERRAAGRRVQPELWLCLGRHGGERGERALVAELGGAWAPGRAAAALALARCGRADLVRGSLARESDPLARASMESAVAGSHDRRAWSPLHGLE